MFHWTDKRIEGHICLCYIAYAMMNHVKNKLRSKKIEMSEDSIRRALTKMQVSLVSQENQLYYMRSKENKDIENIIETFNIRNCLISFLSHLLSIIYK